MRFFDPSKISRFKKARFLQSFSEDELRDRVVRPLLLRQGLLDGREYCGPTEEGKDAVFVHKGPIGFEDLWAVQTKRGNLNMSGKATENVITALTQVQTALSTAIPMIKTRKSQLPVKVILCASGKVNEAARKHIVAKVDDPRVGFLDVDDLIPAIDEHLPELWYGVDSSKVPYLDALLQSLEADWRSATDVETIDPFFCPATDADFAPLSLSRIRIVTRKVRGEIIPEPKFEEFPVTSAHKRRERRILVVGGAGSGKSTSLRRIVSLLARSNSHDHDKVCIPILIRATEIVRSESPLLDTLARHTAKLAKSTSPAFDLSDLEEGLVTLAVDGLDEIPDQEARQRVLTSLLELSATYPRTQIILSARPHAWLDELNGTETFARFDVSPIDWKEAKQIVRRLGRDANLPELQVDEILRRLQEVHGIQLNPLLVSVFVASSMRSRLDVPANVTELFKKFTELMLGRWDEAKGFSQQFHAPLKDFLLSLVAVRMHRRGDTSISLIELDEMLETELATRGISSDGSRSLRDEIVYRSGLFRICGPNEVEFAHMMLQEFFAGRGLEEDEIPRIVSDPWWQRCVVFYFGENAGKASLLASVIQQVSSKTGDELARSAITLGLALQACYLVTMDRKEELYSEILGDLATASAEIFKPEAGARLLDFVGYYIAGRDACACDVIRTGWERVRRLLADKVRAGHPEYEEFWQIVGLIECGALDLALRRIKAFRPTNPQLLLALFMGALMYQHVRIAPKAEKRLAAEICSVLEPKVSHLRRELLKEFRSELIEMRKGSPAAISAYTEDEG